MAMVREERERVMFIVERECALVAADGVRV